MSGRINIPIVAATALICGTALVVFGLQHSKLVAQESQQRLLDSIAEAQLAESRISTAEEQDYFNELADEYVRTMPDDKVLVARLVDDSSHYIYDYEKSNSPSCYIYDLESLNTSVLFGGENGFYCDTKLLIIGAIQDWQRNGDQLVFTAVNRAPETDSTRAFVVFTAGIYDHDLRFVTFKSAN